RLLTLAATAILATTSSTFATTSVASGSTATAGLTGHRVVDAVRKAGGALNETEKALQGIGKLQNKFCGTHRTVHPFRVEGNWVYLIPLHDHGGSRATGNFDAKWKGKKTFRAYLVNVDSSLRATIQFQRKGDKSWSPD